MAWCRSEETHGEENSSIKAHIGVTPKCADDGRFSENSSIKAHIGVTAKCADDGRFSENSSIKAHIGVTAKCADDGRFSENSSIKAHIGVIASCTVAGLLVALHAVAGPFIAPALRKVCLPFVPATATQVKNVMNVLQARSGSLVDIGSGDGRIVIAAAKAGFRAAGFELNPWLVWYSRYRAWREGVSHCTSFHIADLWKVSFSQYSNVVIFGVPQMLRRSG
ncbi:ATP synthase subunit C lysine N-methyltransferase isoform X2 [Electrophorus electricus]|uniref:ATP synthase subunit C lysine N-methyltransferase isoform X2 n=1 Tax=Electrophorus electricus TaxID=8005 RepID=UPI0015D09E1D|nr:ATP synthase subunit C lysine N-methyltransferase isoform X2 [Electrophorus electricus]